MFPDLAKDPKTRNRFEALKYIYALDGEEAKELVEVLEGPEDNDYKLGFTMGRMKLLYEKGLMIHADRIPEIENMDIVLEEIVAKSNGGFKTKEEVFDLFARANYSGNILPVGRVVERTPGKGSFRRIAENSKKVGKKRTTLQRVKELFSK